MKRTTLLALTLPALALAACHGNTDADTTVANNGSAVTEISSETDNGTDNTTIATPAMSGQAFADAAASTDAFEIEAGKLAMANAGDPKLKDFGKMMVDHHSKSTESLKKAAGQVSPAITPMTTMDAEQAANLEKLRGAKGAAFDTLYREQQIAAHQKALAAMKAYSQGGGVPQLKDFATNTIPVVQSHLERLQGM